MTYKEFMALVAEMRRAQKAYSKMRTSDNLTLAKKLEKAVDEEIKTMPENDNQLNLF